MLLLEHPSVYTAGKRTEPWDRPVDGTPVVDVDRGGKITWHGPGQLVGYPILRLPDPVDVVAYVRRTEELLIDVCAEVGLSAGRVEGAAASGCPRTTGAGPQGGRHRHPGRPGRHQHGFSINCDCDLTYFDQIVPCGIRDAGVTSLTAELGRPISVADVLPVVERRLSTLVTV
ncbi:lipoyl(octanoyl) transferase LipB [Micromonospora sp. M12]